MEHTQPLPACVVEHQEFHKHIEESGPIRDKVIQHDERIITLFKGVDANTDAIATISEKIDASTKKTQDTVIGGVLALITVIVLTLLWTGRYIEKVERLDKAHQSEFSNQK